MGDSQHRAGPTVGKVIYVWKEGTEYGNMLRGWIGPISMATAVSKYSPASTFFQTKLKSSGVPGYGMQFRLRQMMSGVLPISFPLAKKSTWPK